MQTIIELDGLKLAVQAEGVEAIAGGYLLSGRQVGLLHDFDAVQFYRHGFHSWSLSCWLDLGRPMLPLALQSMWPMNDDPALLLDYPFTGSGVGALGNTGGKVLLLGALDLSGRVRGDAQVLRGTSTLSAAPSASSEQVPSTGSAPGASTSPARGAPPAWFLGYGEEQAVFARYAALLGERLSRRGQGQAPRVWCSWYSLYRDIDEGTLRMALDGLAGLPFEVYQVDDGWQQTIGDWEANDKFPSGMAELAGRARNAGFTPGLWLAPLIVQPASSVYRQHPDWLVRDEQGQPVSAGLNWGGPVYGLDTTHPEVQEWLSGLITRVRGWGYDYLKLDFLYGAALEGVRYRQVSGEEAYREGLAVMRQAAGEAYILACGCPILASLGLADGMRIGPDVAPFWDNPERSFFMHDYSGPSTLNAIRTSLHRLWLKDLTHTDPDVAFFRTRYNLLQPGEKDFLRNLALIADFRATSDLPGWLDPEERQALQSFLEATPQIERTGRYLFRVDRRDVDYGFVRLV